MAARRKNKPLCNAETRNGPCLNYKDTCPYKSHRTANPSSPDVTISADDIIIEEEAESGSRAPELHRNGNFRRILETAAKHYRLTEHQVCRDYHLIRALHVLGRMFGPDLRVPAVRTTSHETVGHLLFGGGTALSAAWQVSERYSEDIGMVLVPASGVNTKHIKQGLRKLGETWANRLGGLYKRYQHDTKHDFFVINIQDPAIGPIQLDVDITIKRLQQPPNYFQQRQPVSLLGRLADENMAESQPELGRSSLSSRVATMGPGLTAMEKLLAQTNLSQKNYQQGIRGRARDVYDLASLADQKHLFEGNIGRDSPALLALAEEHRLDVDAAKRPAEGFASIASFRKGTPQYEALAAGYEQMQENIVWGRRIPLDHAIALAVSLDPGPASPFQPGR